MTASLPRRVVVTAGPTISPTEVRQLLPAAEVVGPIAFGDTYRYELWAGDTLLVIDGLFLQQPSVRHRELLELIDQGVRVAGCSSMGALRAAELAPFGMLGYGQIYDGYRTWRIQADDEVAMVHGHADVGYPVIIDALVNMRATLTAAAGGGLITTSLAERIVNVASGLPFTHRSWQQLLPQAGLPVDLVEMRVDTPRRADRGPPADMATTPRRAAPGDHRTRPDERPGRSPDRHLGDNVPARYGHGADTP